MSMSAAAPQFVILPGEQLEQLAITLESVAGALPGAGIHVVRPGMAASDAIADLVGSAGFQVIDVRGRDGFAAVLGQLDRHFGDRPYCWLFAGEALDADAAATLGRGGQLVPEQLMQWLEVPSPIAAPRVRSGGSTVSSPHGAGLASFLPDASWRAVVLRDQRAEFVTWNDVYADLAVLAHLGELDAAYQRAELSWPVAGDDGEAELRLVRAAVMLAWLQDCTTSTIPACSRWFALEPTPFVAMMYVRVACGSVPFVLIDRLLAMFPRHAEVRYRDGLMVERPEAVRQVWSVAERERQTATLRHQGIVRLMRAGQATSSEIGIALSLAFLIGAAPSTVIDAMSPGEQDPMIGDCLNPNLEAPFVADMIGALQVRFDGQWWLDQFVRRFVSTRNLAAVLALDQAGVSGYDHWSTLASLSWLAVEARARALVRAVAHGEMDATTALALAADLGGDATDLVANGLQDLALEQVVA